MALTAAAAVVAAGAYLDGKYQLKRDYERIRKLKRAERAYSAAAQADRLSPWYLLADVCSRLPNNRAIWTRERSWTFKEVHDQIARYAQWMLSEGIKPGDLVALYLHNSAEFMMLLFATHCVGAGPALVNYNLEGKALLHCLAVCDSRLLIIDSDPECQRRIQTSQAEISSSRTKIVTLDEELKRQVNSLHCQVPDKSLRAGIKGNWPFILIYTSGTTGLPKGCPFTVARTWMMGSYLEPSYGSKPGKDCWYCAMPLYHATGTINTASSLFGGIGIALAPRFSVKNFWPDVHESESTGFIYVGETARYLLAAQPHPLERKHKLRLACGNGLRPDVWKKLQTRFNIPEIVEFFNSSEGVLALLVWARNDYLSNCVGHHGLLFRRMLNNYYVPVQIDPETGDIWRDPQTGFAKRTPFEEGGEILVAVPAKETFGGYWKNAEATDKKFAVNVFRKGDLYYRSGDALRRDADGHWYFLDRLGDTFRWKSENVSTAEVAEVLGNFPGVAEANVYGVTVPGYEGRAGCAALNMSVTANDTFFKDLLRYARSQLQKQAVPVFLRIVKNSSHIHNHKQNKVGLRQEGIDPEKWGTVEKGGEEDSFLWWDPASDNYVPFSKREWESISGGAVKL